MSDCIEFSWKKKKERRTWPFLTCCKKQHNKCSTHLFFYSNSLVVSHLLTNTLCSSSLSNNVLKIVRTKTWLRTTLVSTCVRLILSTSDLEPYFGPESPELGRHSGENLFLLYVRSMDRFSYDTWSRTNSSIVIDAIRLDHPSCLGHFKSISSTVLLQLYGSQDGSILYWDRLSICISFSPVRE